jgi:uncharacterized protein (TIGR02217 family)
MAFNEVRLPDCVAYGFTVTPRYDTLIVRLDNGKEVRNVNWTKPKRLFSAMYQNFTKLKFQFLLHAFHASAGSAYPFRCKDWTDFEVTNGALGTTPGANQTPVQLVKVYTFGSRTRTRTITKPNSSGFTLYQNGVAKAGTLDTVTGLFTPTTNWTAAAALTWTGTFDVPVRFKSDEMPSSFDDIDAINTAVELEEDFL